MTRILLIRHAATDTAGKTLTGRMPGIHLSAEGIAQAKVLARRLAKCRIEAIYSSPLERAMETCTPIARMLKILPNIYEDLTEINFGGWTGAEIEELKQQRNFQLFNSFRSCSRIPSGELMVEAQLRMIKSIEHLSLRHPGKAVILVSHADMIKAAITYYAGIHLDLLQRIAIDPASVSILELHDETVRISTINNTGKIML